MDTLNAQTLVKFFEDKKHIVVVQGDNPDGDSLASALALESLLSAQGIQISLYCSIDMGKYMRYLDGWDRVSSELPEDFDAWILVDCEYLRLLDNVSVSGDLPRLREKPLLVIDHHASPTDIDFAEYIANVPTAGSTGHVIYEIATILGWDINVQAAELICVSILADTLGFNSEITTNNSSPLRVVADLIDKGVSLASLNERRIKQFRITPEIFRYKAELMQRVEFHYDHQIATIDIPHDEIKEFSTDYNPTVVLDETRMIEGLAVTIGFKTYNRGGSIYKITGRIRCGFGYFFAAELASHFKDGGGHPYAAGFKIEGDNLDFAQIKREALDKAYQLLTDAQNK